MANFLCVGINQSPNQSKHFPIFVLIDLSDGFLCGQNVDLILSWPWRCGPVCVCMCLYSSCNTQI